MFDGHTSCYGEIPVASDVALQKKLGILAENFSFQGSELFSSQMNE